MAQFTSQRSSTIRDMLQLQVLLLVLLLVVFIIFLWLLKMIISGNYPSIGSTGSHLGLPNNNEVEGQVNVNHAQIINEIDGDKVDTAQKKVISSEILSNTKAKQINMGELEVHNRINPGSTLADVKAK